MHACLKISYHVCSSTQKNIPSMLIVQNRAKFYFRKKILICPLTVANIYTRYLVYIHLVSPFLKLPFPECENLAVTLCQVHPFPPSPSHFNSFNKGSLNPCTSSINLQSVKCRMLILRVQNTCSQATTPGKQRGSLPHPPPRPPLPKDGCSVLPLTALFALGINWHGCRVPWALGAQWIHSLLAPGKQVGFWVGAVCKALCVLVLTENSSCVPGCSDEDAICKQEGL